MSRGSGGPRRSGGPRSHPDTSVRPAVPGDERAIAALQWGAWRALLTGEELAAQGLSEERLRAGWEVALSSPRPASAALVVALHGNSVVGFALAGPDDEAGAVRGQASVAGGPPGVVRGQAAPAGGPPGAVRGQAASAGGPPGAVRGQAASAGGPPGAVRGQAGGAPAAVPTQIYELVVEPRFCRSGHGSRMLAAVADLVGGAMRVWIDARDEARQRFFSSAGFAPAGAGRTIGDGYTQHLWWARAE